MLDLDNLTTHTKNKFKVCDRCRGSNLRTLIPRLNKLDEDAEIEMGCHSYCGPGRDYPFVFVNNKPVLAKDEDELIQKVSEML